jgi:hypothetical protein
MSIGLRSIAAANASLAYNIDPTARLVRCCATLALALSAFSACSNSMGSTAEFGTFEHASIQGVVLSDKGTPLDSVAISLRPPEGRGAYNGGAIPPRTGTDGRFRVDLDRVAPPPNFTPPSPDTLTVRLIGAYLGAKGGGTLPKDTVFVLVHLVPRDQEAEMASATLHIALP